MKSRVLGSLGQYPRAIRSCLVIVAAISADKLLNSGTVEQESGSLLSQFSLLRPVQAHQAQSASRSSGAVSNPANPFEEFLEAKKAPRHPQARQLEEAVT